MADFFPSDERFYRAAVIINIGGQILSNIFYAGRQDGTPVEFNTASMTEFAQEIVNQLFSGLQNLLPTSALINMIRVSMIDEYNQNRGFYDIEYPVSHPGYLTFALDGYGPAAILAFTCDPINAAQAYRVPKHTYVAIGPVPGTYILDDGMLNGAYTTLMETLGDAIAAFNYIDSQTSWQMTGIRVGRPNKDSIGAAGEIVDSIARPYVSNRRSRMISPRGE
jgi:hypothetical protein